MAGTEYVPLAKEPDGKAELGKGLEGNQVSLTIRPQGWLSKRITITSKNKNDDFMLVRKLSCGIKYELHSSSETGPIVLQATQHPFSHKSTLWGPQQTPITLKRKWLHIGNSFEYQGKQYRWDGHFWSCPYHQELIDLKTGATLAVFKKAGHFNRTCELSIKEKEVDPEWLAIMLMAAMVTFRQWQQRRRCAQAHTGGT